LLFLSRAVFWFAAVAALMPNHPLRNTALAEGPLTFERVVDGLFASADNVSFSCAENPKLCDAAVDLFSEASGLLDEAAGGIAQTNSGATP